MVYIRQEKFISKFISTDKNFQEIIKNKKIAIIGIGGIGSILCELLIRGGFLNLIIIDNDIVELSNIQRQIFFREDIGKYKIDAIENRLIKINPNISINKNKLLVNNKNINEICENVDLIIDATDNFKIRNIINNFCKENNKDWIYNGAIKSEIVSFIFKYSNKNKIFNKYLKILKMLDSEETENETFGILASTTFVSASIAYNQILKYFLNIEEYRFIKFDIWKNKCFNLNI